MTQAGRERRVLEALVSLVDSLLADFDVVELLTQLTERCSELLDIASAGLLLADSRGQLHLMAATSKRTHDLELFQLHHDEGPCLECYATGEGVNVSDLRAETGRWSQFAPAAIKAGFAAVHAVPMRAGGTVVGALNLFGSTIGALDPADLLVGQTLAHIATVAILQANAPAPDTVLPQLQSALASRVVVEQATGFLRQHLDVSINEAFEMIRRYAQANGDHLTDVARTLVSDRSRRPQVLTGMSQMLAERTSVSSRA